VQSLAVPAAAAAAAAAAAGGRGGVSSWHPCSDAISAI